MNKQTSKQTTLVFLELISELKSLSIPSLEAKWSSWSQSQVTVLAASLVAMFLSKELGMPPCCEWPSTLSRTVK